MRRWWRCWNEGHKATVWMGWLLPDQAVVRCDCGRGIRPRLVYVHTEGVDITRQVLDRVVALERRCAP